MTSTDPKALEKIKHKAKNSFEQSNPETWGQFSGNAEKIAEARKVEERAMTIRKRLAEHCKKHRSEWVAKEAATVYDERQHSNHPAPRPNWASPHHNVQPIMEEARNRVQHRIQNRIKQVGEIERNMKTRIAQNMEPQRERSISQAKTPDLQQDFSQSM